MNLNESNNLASELKTKNESENLYMGLITLANPDYGLMTLASPDYEGKLCQIQSIVRATSREHAIDQLDVLVTSGEYLPEEWSHCFLLRIDVSVIDQDSGEYQVLENWFGQQWQSDINSHLS